MQIKGKASDLKGVARAQQFSGNRQDFEKRHKKAAVAAEFILALPGTPSENAGYRAARWILRHWVCTGHGSQGSGQGIRGRHYEKICISCNSCGRPDQFSGLRRRHAGQGAAGGAAAAATTTMGLRHHHRADERL
jgi:hypothetical protein